MNNNKKDILMLDKFRDNPIKIIGTVLTYIGIALLLLSLFVISKKSNADLIVALCAIILMAIGTIILIISWIINKELLKEGAKLTIIGGGWLFLSIFGVGYWLANIMICTSLVFMLLGIILPIINWIINKWIN